MNEISVSSDADDFRGDMAFIKKSVLSEKQTLHLDNETEIIADQACRKLLREANLGSFNRTLLDILSSRNKAAYWDVSIKLSFLVLAAILIYGYMRALHQQMKHLQPVFDSMTKTLFGDFSKPIKFEQASNFCYEPFFGRKKRMLEVVDRLETITTWINNLPPKTLHDRIIPANMAYLLTGPPGTGKTLFVKKVAYFLEKRLREKHLKETETEESINEMKKSKEYVRRLKTMDPFVYFAYITPSSIYDKYVGETEKKIEAIFLAAEETAKTKKYATVILMFDEAEALFGDRKRRSAAGGGIYESFSSQFLARLSAVQTEYKNVYIFAATNLKDVLDKAFLRRFANKLNFPKPNLGERRQLVQQTFKGHEVSSDLIKKIIAATKGCSHAYIIRNIKMNMRYSKGTANFAGFDEKNFFNNLAEDKQNGDTD